MLVNEYCLMGSTLTILNLLLFQLYCNLFTQFGHLMNQYSASYYGYMWAEVLSADMFATRFEEEGIMNPQTGMDYRKMVLAPGGTGRIMDHLTNFLGRKPSDEAFLKSRGIVS